MIGVDEIAAVIGRQQLEAVRKSDLPQRATMTLLSVWTDGSPGKLKQLAQRKELMPRLRELRANLEDAADVMGSTGNVTEAEALQMAGIQLRL